jgi:hypothetical protein
MYKMLIRVDVESIGRVGLLNKMYVKPILEYTRGDKIVGRLCLPKRGA